MDSQIGPDELHFPLMHEKRDFLNAVKSRGATLEDAEVGHRTASLGHLGQIAIQLGRKLTWDPDKERFMGDDEANKLLSLPPGRSPWALPAGVIARGIHARRHSERGEESPQNQARSFATLRMTLDRG